MSRTYEPKLLTDMGLSKADEGNGVRVYFDVETYRKQDAFLEERVIAIGVVEDRDCLPTDTDQLPPIDPKRFYEWNVKEIEWASEYWLRKREPVPTTKVAKCEYISLVSKKKRRE